VLGAWLVTGAAWAQPADESGEAPVYQTVVTPSRGEGTEFDSDRSVFAVDSEALDSGSFADVPEALADVPGVFVQRTNRGAGLPLIRGLVGPQNVLLIDGLRFNQATFRTGPNQYSALVDPSALSRVEVVLGPGSVLYGSDAMGGVVNMIPRGLPDQDGLWGRADASFATADLGTDMSLDLGGRAGVVSGYVGGSFRRFDTLRTGGGDDVPQSDYTQQDWRGRLGVELGDGWELGLAYLADKTDGAGRIDQLGRGEVRLYDNVDHFAYLDARRRGRGWLRDVRLALSYHRSEERVYRSNCETDDGVVTDLDACAALSDRVISKKRFNEDIVDSAGLLAQATGSWLDGRLDVTLGSETNIDWVDSKREDAAATDAGFVFEPKDRGDFSAGSSYLMTGAFLYAEGRPWLDPEVGELVLSGGLRVSHTAARAPGVPGLGDVEWDDTGVVFSGGARLLLANHYNLYANFSQGFRAPNLQEVTVLGDTGSNFEIPNGDLGPEKSHTVELGFKLNRAWMRLGAAFFYSLIDDFIDREDATFDGQAEVGGKPVVRRVNAGEATYLGVEGRLEVGPFAGFTVFGNVSWMQGDVTDRDGEEQPARRVPPLQGIGGLRFEGLDDRLGVDLFVRWADRQDRLNSGDRSDLRICEDRSAPGTLKDPCHGGEAWLSPGVRARYLVTDDVRVHAAVENLIDEQYRMYGSGFDAPGVSAEIGAVVEF
jgi:outer membrane receptor protein involved in Fe transport